jgi:hypothetical protein
MVPAKKEISNGDRNKRIEYGTRHLKAVSSDGEKVHWQK